MADTRDRDARLAFLKMDPSIRPLLQEAGQVLEPHIEGILDAFYDHLRATPGMMEMFDSPARMKHARDMQRAHWMNTIFKGTIDDAYFDNADRIGRIHERVGLEPRWYLGGYAFVIKRVEAIVMETYRRKPQRGIAIMGAVTQALFLDMDIVISSYVHTARDNLKKVLENYAREFKSSVQDTVQIVAAAATELQNTAASMRHTSEATATQVRHVADSASEASENVRGVANASEELNAAIEEITRQVTDSLRISNEAVDKAERGNTLVASLTESADKIGTVVRFITDIAAQTNLLALNATIEAARAGDAGKGFAVVANEVKTLAGQTARATEEISAQVGAVQGATRETVTAIQGIGGTIALVREISEAIAAAVEEQCAATREIARNVGSASAATDDVASTITNVREMAHETGSAAAEVQTSAADLARQSEELRAKVDSFLEAIRSSVV
ncbi:chemotaxis protein [Roseospira marina]|uniref:Chemotaxis protein n=1 Tax=Roseospira marina TaxID=140057 RepID=A0A5M6IFY4_9PROT|nr:globin-coupled sensor protein [Roseospira marina]KAA5607200.1 chemotaxis protein [Roseospira marina]MBB4312650.1 methyl-accepting chemotaxis protein [Roseospira marina]MBB5085334.1 methyl-accepting chemotaxis protein [Roseospira marina]